MGVLRNGDEDEQKSHHKFLGEQFDLTKDEDKVKMGRKGGLKTEENVCETESQLVVSGMRIGKLECEKWRLKAVISTVNNLTSTIE